MQRRAFIGLIVAATAAWPIAVRAQQSVGARRVGILLPADRNDSEYPNLITAFVQELRQLGWTDGRNLRLDIRWSGSNADGIRRSAAELVALAPDVIVAPGSASVGPLLQTTRSVPVVFLVVPDPVEAGFVKSLARPGGNATGFTSFEYVIGGKWLALLKEIAPTVARVAVIRDSAITAGVGQWQAIKNAAPSIGVEAVSLNSSNADEIERAMTSFARNPNGGLIVTSSALSVQHRDLIVMLAARHKLPALYYSRAFVARGGLLSYGPERVDQFRRAAGYVDRILKGAKPDELPVQNPTKYELVINLKTAKSLDLTISNTLLVSAGEVIE